MYTLAVRKDFIARHFLIGGDWGPENNPNSHHYLLELKLTAENLDEHGYLVDIVEVERHLAELVGYYNEQMLNELPEFSGLNPSIEHFARILCNAFNERLKALNLHRLEVVLWENEKAWVSYKIKR
jgi:6-pyruvoyltetrahydropterin/6-carboxytetrahydropterin synthase